jgi:hypothetical protein
VVGAVFADRNAPALGGILNQQGVGNLTVYGGGIFEYMDGHGLYLILDGDLAI